MNTVAGTITLDWNQIIPESFDFDIIESLEKSWNKTIYFFWETPLESSDDFLLESKNILWKILHSDISISSENKIHLSLFDYDEGFYELARFEWEQVSFSEIKKRFSESPDVISIRESDISKRFWNKIIIVDFVY